MLLDLFDVKPKAESVKDKVDELYNELLAYDCPSATVAVDEVCAWPVMVCAELE